MKAVILAAGYGTRLQRDVENDTTGTFKHLLGIAKPLLPVGHCALITHWIKAMTASKCVDTIFVITNALYFEPFQEWAREFPNVKILSDGTRTNEGRLGAVACLQLAIKHFSVDDHVIVVGGDTLFKEDFSLLKFTGRFSEAQGKHSDASLVLCYQCKEEETSKYGILEVDEDMRVTCMKEKPQPIDTQSRKACPCFYLFSQESLPLLDEFLGEKKSLEVDYALPDSENGCKHRRKNAPIQERDAPGTFLSWLILRRPVYVQEILGRFDVGNLPSYIECDKYFKDRVQDTSVYLQ